MEGVALFFFSNAIISKSKIAGFLIQRRSHTCHGTAEKLLLRYFQPLAQRHAPFQATRRTRPPGLRSVIDLHQLTIELEYQSGLSLLLSLFLLWHVLSVRIAPPLCTSIIHALTHTHTLSHTHAHTHTLSHSTVDHFCHQPVPHIFLPKSRNLLWHLLFSISLEITSETIFSSSSSSS